ncbi:hypothetical protein GCM10018785_11540 [Streptomyces longispororuber]|uniref:Uncharacterized protein n=1 Tax=Streptomyces longispororuber TaxID=68230 RepID=A0A919DFQ0_9ACTN|nr:hypothetical protein [Streptomyces longispororuber]GHE43670.1 hypothetical protein GCM10018785_11540 [Streptomyces longispororuber]
MLSAPRGLLFWLVLIILLFVIAVAPVESAHFFLDLVHAIEKFFTGLRKFLETLSMS